MKSIRYRWPGRALALLALLTALAGTATAREGFYLGGGLASQSVSGDLDGTQGILATSQTVVIIPGALDTGSGLALLVGYGFIPMLSVEYLFASTSHKASTNLVNLDSDATLAAGLIGLRANLLVDDNLELFARLGVSSGIAEYKSYALHGSMQSGTFVYNSTSSAKFTGAGIGYGVGAELFLAKVGFGASYSVLAVNFTQAEGGGASGALPSTLSSSITQLALTVTYSFGNFQ